MGWVLAAAIALIVVLLIKIYLLKKSAREIGDKFADILKTDTNTLVDISSRDKDMCELADSINKQLKILRKEHLQYHQGNTELKNAITTMKQLTEELFRYSMIVSNESKEDTEEVFVNQVLAESISSFYPVLTEKGITPQIHITDTRIVRNVNRSELARVFSNLLNNAVKYSDGDLEITLSDPGEITFSNTAEQLFDRFYTVEAAHHSTGLGLSIARTLVKRMGGTITADYDNGRLTIRIML